MAGAPVSEPRLADKGSRCGGRQRHAALAPLARRVPPVLSGSAGGRRCNVLEMLEASDGEQCFCHKPTGLLCEHIFARFKVHMRDRRAHAIEAIAVAAAFLRTCLSPLFWMPIALACRPTPLRSQHRWLR